MRTVHPPELQRLHADSTVIDSHLAFVPLYTPFKDQPEQYSDMYTVSHSFANYVCKTAVILLRQIFGLPQLPLDTMLRR